jgi:hypothetical protein
MTRPPVRCPVQYRAALLATATVAGCGLISGCYVPGARNALPVSQSVSALASVCTPDSARGSVTNQASVAVSARLRVRWLSLTSAVLASAQVSIGKVPAHGSVTWSVTPNHHAPNVLSCDTALSDVRAR